MPDLAYSSDAPLASRDGDLFDRWPFAERVAHVLRDRRDASSLVVGLYGGWGEGKTTVLNFIEQALDGAEGVVVVRFNPWRFGDEATLIRSFFGALAAAVDAKLTTRGEDFARAASRYAGVLSVGGFGVTLDAEKAAEAFAEVDPDALRARLTGVLAEAGLRVVVRVDDIDRLDKDEVQAVFRLVKLSADFEHVAYVLALDPDVVAAALQERYGPGQARAGYDFLEKIVTVPLQLPPARPQALYALCVEAVDEALSLAGIHLDENDGLRTARAFQQGLLPAVRTPRMAKRYGNAIRFALPILAGEVDASDQLLIEGMRVVYPALYEHVRSHPETYLRSGIGTYLGNGDQMKEQARRKEEIRSIVYEKAPTYPEAAISLVKHLFPAAAGGHVYGNPIRDQRAASRWYFDRYFSYAISGDDVPDRDFNEAMSLAEAGDAEGCAERLRALLSDATQERLAEMLRTRASAPTNGAESLARHFDRLRRVHVPPAGVRVLGRVVSFERRSRLDRVNSGRGPPGRRVDGHRADGVVSNVCDAHARVGVPD